MTHNKVILIDVAMGDEYSYDDLQKMKKQYICAECDSELLIWQDATVKALRLTCGAKHDHRGFADPEADKVDVIDRGGSVIEVSNKTRSLQHQGLSHAQASAVMQWRSMTPAALASVLMLLYPCKVYQSGPHKGELDTRFGVADMDAALALATVAIDADLSPFNKEVIMYQGQPMETAKGTWKRVNDPKRTPDFVRMETRRAKQDEYEEMEAIWDIDRTHADILMRTDCYTVKSKDKPAFTTWALTKRSEVRESNAYTHMAKDPVDMTRKRSEQRAGRRMAGDATKTIEADMPLLDGNVFEASWREVSPKQLAEAVSDPKGQPTPRPSSTGQAEAKKSAPVTSSKGKSEEDILIRCPLHGVDWHTAKWGDLTHRDGDEWCNFKNIVGDRMKSAREELVMSESVFTERLKEKYEGKTWSKLSPSQMLQATLDLEAEAVASRQKVAMGQEK